MIQIFSADGRDGTGPTKGSTRGPRGPKNTIFHATTYKRYNLGVATVKGKRKEGVEENANKLDHLKPGQVPGQLLRHLESTTTR